MSCGVSTWWRGRGTRVSCQMSPGRKGEWGWWSEESLSSPVPVAPAPDLPLSHPWRPPAQPQAHSRGPFLCSEQGRGGPRLALVCVLPPKVWLAYPTTGSLGTETPEFMGRGGSGQQVTSPQDTSNTLEASRAYALGFELDFTT